MSDIIQLLPDAIANQIAAGEVIQRPASVVKELLENAVDAGATRIQLIVKDSGSTLVQVIDDGCGMSETDARMSFERHATSKIRAADDLFAIRTMGFRGEALASVAAVAQVELRTRRHAEDLGIRILVEGTEVKAQEPCQCPPGTSFAVKNLFFNVPARRNFLKSASVEMRHINDEFTRVALANADVYFSLHHNGTEVYHLPAGNLRQRIVSLFGQSYNKRLVPVGEDTDVLKISGYIGKPEFAKKTRGEQFFFVNGRFIKSSYLHHAVMMAYEELLQKEYHPLYVIFLELDPSRIDINVHPTKQEIKFEDERLIYNYLKVSVRHALGQFSVMPTLDFEAEGTFGANRLPVGPRTERSGGGGDTAPARATSRSESADDNSGLTGMRGEQRLAQTNLRHWESLYAGLDDDSADAPPLVIESLLGQPESEVDATLASSGELKEPYQLHGSYIISPIKSGYLLIDQQTAHERILYEQYLRALREQASPSQQQLFPRTIELSPIDADTLRTMLTELKSLGFDIEPFGGNSFVVHGIPAEVAGRQDEEQLLDSLLAQYKQDTELKLGAHERIAKALARSAAIGRGKTLTVEEMRTLIDRLFACELPYQGPSGRQCFLTFELDELQRRFEG